MKKLLAFLISGALALSMVACGGGGEEAADDAKTVVYWAMWESGYVPVLKSVAQNQAYADFIAQADGGKYISALSAKVCLEQESAYYTSPAFNGSSAARDQVGALMAKCLPLTSNVEAQIATAFEDAVAECEYAS